MVAFEERDCKSKVDETPLARVEKVQRCSGLCPPQRSLVDGLAGWSMGWLVGRWVGWLVDGLVGWSMGWLVGRWVGWLVDGLAGWSMG